MNLKQEEIYNTTFELFKKYGIKSISMDEISAKVGISKKTLYTIFDDKLDLVSKILEKENDINIQKLETILNEDDNSIVILIKVFALAWNEISKISPVLYYDFKKYYPTICEHNNEKTIKLGSEIVKKILEKGKNEGLFNKYIDESFVSKIIVIQFISLINNETIKNELNEEIYYKQFFSLFLRSVLSPKIQLIIEEEFNKLNGMKNISEFLVFLNNIKVEK